MDSRGHVIEAWTTEIRVRAPKMSVREQVLSNTCIGLAGDVLGVSVAQVVRAHMRGYPGTLDDPHDELTQRLT